MSGGTFDHQDWVVSQLADQVRDIIESAENKNQYSEETMAVLLQAKKHLRLAAVYIHRIDWLVAGDDGEDTFHVRLQQDIEDIL
jgi:hypothetical protein